MNPGDYILIEKFVYLVVRFQPEFDAITLECHGDKTRHIMSLAMLKREMVSGKVKHCGELGFLLYSI